MAQCLLPTQSTRVRIAGVDCRFSFLVSLVITVLSFFSYNTHPFSLMSHPSNVLHNGQNIFAMKTKMLQAHRSFNSTGLAGIRLQRDDVEYSSVVSYAFQGTILRTLYISWKKHLKLHFIQLLRRKNVASHWMAAEHGPLHHDASQEFRRGRMPGRGTRY